MSRPKTPATCSDPICQPNLRRVAKFKRSGGQSWQPNGWAAALFFWARNSWHGMVDWCLPPCDRIWCQLFITIESISYSISHLIQCWQVFQGTTLWIALGKFNPHMCRRCWFLPTGGSRRNRISDGTTCFYIILTFLQGQSTPCRAKDCRKQCDQSSCTAPSLAKRKQASGLTPLVLCMNHQSKSSGKRGWTNTLNRCNRIAPLLKIELVECYSLGSQVGKSQLIICNM